MSEIALTTMLTCPQCGHKEEIAMPRDACQWYFDCNGCGKVLRPKRGDCCVFCSYGSTPCPSKQAGDGRCG